MVAMRGWVCGPWRPPRCGGGLGVSLALVQVLQPAELLQELGPGVAIVLAGAQAWAQRLLQHQAVGPQEGVVGALLSQGGRALWEQRHLALVGRTWRMNPTGEAPPPRPGDQGFSLRDP